MAIGVIPVESLGHSISPAGREESGHVEKSSVTVDAAAGSGLGL